MVVAFGYPVLLDALLVHPRSGVAASHEPFHEGIARNSPAEWLANEYYGDDVNQMADIARSETGISTLHEATGGDPSRSRRWDNNRSMGSDQEMIARLQAPSGDVWGMLGLYREPGRPMFDATDKRFLSAVSEHLAEGARRAILVGEATDPPRPLSRRPRPDHRLRAMGTAVRHPRRRPLAGRASRRRRRLRPAPARRGGCRRPGAAQRRGTRRPAGITVSRIRSRSGTWVVLHGACLE